MTTDSIKWYATRTGNVAVPSNQQTDVDKYHYAPARRAGDFVFVSGIVASNPDRKGMSLEGFKVELRAVFRRMERLLIACESQLSDVVELQMFHVFGSAKLQLNKAEQLAAIAAIRDEFFIAPYPSAVELGVAELNDKDGLVEVKAIACSPRS